MKPWYLSYLHGQSQPRREAPRSAKLLPFAASQDGDQGRPAAQGSVMLALAASSLEQHGSTSGKSRKPQAQVCHDVTKNSQSDSGLSAGSLGQGGCFIDVPWWGTKRRNCCHFQPRHCTSKHFPAGKERAHSSPQLMTSQSWTSCVKRIHCIRCIKCMVYIVYTMYIV